MFLGYFSFQQGALGVLWGFQGCFRGVLMVLEGCFQGVLCGFRRVLTGFKDILKDVSKVFYARVF